MAMPKKRIFECCGILYSGRNTLLKHTTACHIKGEGFKCQICNQIFEKPSKLRLHKLKMHSKVQLLPSHSDFITKSEYKFKKHSKTNKFKTNKIFECCDIRFENAKAIKKHTCAYHPDGLICATCKRDFKKPSQLRCHKLTHSNSKSTAVRDTDLNYDEKKSSERKENPSTSPNKINRKRNHGANSASDSIKDDLPISQSVGVQLQHGRLTTEKVLSFPNDSSKNFLLLSDQPIKSIHEEIRQIRTQTLLAITVSTLMPLLKSLMVLSSSLLKQIREKREIDTCSQIIETFEYVWNTFKMVIVRWEDLKGPVSQDASLSLIQNSHGALPVFINWKSSEHLEVLENAIVLSLNTVNHWQPAPPASKQLDMKVKVEPVAVDSTNMRHQSSKPRIKTEETVNEELERKVASFVAAKNFVSVPSKKVKETNIREVMEFCRLLNTAIWQNTKERIMGGFRDDSGDYHAMYRYGISKIISLYCPPGVTLLKCCKKLFNLSELKAHVSQYHESGNAGRTEPSISPL
uniref:C2H2-type domain-containing protein n=1 Tax=Daphnia galeata TaxID=27404 RepID=A0A8J2RX58_9CRUS|nr:unnamed protein product [Daphnia galeata]